MTKEMTERRMDPPPQSLGLLQIPQHLFDLNEEGRHCSLFYRRPQRTSLLDHVVTMDQNIAHPDDFPSTPPGVIFRREFHWQTARSFSNDF